MKRFQRILFIHLTLVLAAAVFAGCFGVSEVQSLENEFNYSGSSFSFSPQFKVYHSSDSHSKFQVKLKSSQILYNRKNSDENFTAYFEAIGVISEKNTRQTIDTVKLKLADSSPKLEDRYLFGETEFQLSSGKDYIIEIDFTDVKRDVSFHTKMTVNKTDLMILENFEFTEPEKSIPILDPFITAEKQLHINSDRLNLEEVSVSSKGALLDLPPPPYSNSRTKLPSIEEFSPIDCSKSESTISLSLTKAQDILLQRESEESLVILIRPNNFPAVTNPYELMLPLRYISSRKEFERMSEGNNVKVSLDNFWLECGKEKKRAQELIAKYYSRVEDANTYFSSYKSGWRTDRGLIHIIFGSPNSIDTAEGSEIWTYGDNSNLGSIEFKFDFIENDFSKNHYTLTRDPIYKSEWAKRVESWRNGRIFN